MDPLKLQRAMDLHRNGQLAEAERLYREILQRDPRDAEALYLLGIAALATNRPQRAADLLTRSIRQRPDFPPAHANRGIALAALKRPAEALVSYDKAIALQPGFVEAHFNRAALLHDTGRYEEAVAGFDQVLALRPDDAEAHNDRGNALNASQRYEEALVSLDRALSLRPDFAAALCNRGNALNGLKRPQEALENYDRALALDRQSAEAWCNRGDALHELRRFDTATASFETALSLRPDMAEAHFGLGLSLLTIGRYQDGFRHYEWRTRRRGVAAAPRNMPRPAWTGETALRGRTLFIHPELYLGDMIQFCRYATLAHAAGAQVILAARAPLRRLLETLGPSITVIGEDDRPLRYDLHCPLMSLPLAFHTTIDSVPAPIPYLHPQTDRVEVWRQRIGGDGFKLGICWQGSPLSTGMDRSIPLTRFRALADVPNLRLISLQTGPGTEQLADLPPGMAVQQFPDPPDGMRPFEETAAMMANLDLIITPDTAFAHLAGALGRPVWVALKHAADWRWGVQGDFSPWYPTMRLFRQQTAGDWHGVIDAMRQALMERQ